MQTKTCIKCLIDKPLDSFTRRNDRKNSYRWRCKACEAKAATERRNENRNHYNTVQKNYTIKNRDHYLKMKREKEKRYRENPEYRAKVYARTKKYMSSDRWKEVLRRAYRKWFDIWDDVIYCDYKHKILEIIPRKWYKIRRYWPTWFTIIVPRRLLKKRIVSL